MFSPINATNLDRHTQKWAARSDLAVDGWMPFFGKIWLDIAAKAEVLSARTGRGAMELSHRAGYSVIEILAAMAVMGIVAAIALPAWNRLLPSQHLDSSVRQIQSELQNIKMRAAAENLGFQLEYLAGASEYTIQREGKSVAIKPLPGGVKISKAGVIFFSPRGTAGGNRIRLHSPDGLCRHVVVSATGRIRMCRPTDCAGDC